METSTLFIVQGHRFASAAIQKNPQLDWHDVRQKYNELNDHAYEHWSVRKIKLRVVARQLDAYYQTKPLFKNQEDLLMEIYNRAPQLLPGAIETLDSISTLGKPMSLATHGDNDWSNLKIDERGLRKYFASIEIVNEAKRKGPEDWARAIKRLHLAPSQILGIGDNLTGDIMSLRQIGVRHLIWVKPSWSVYANGTAPDDVWKIDSIKEMPSTIVKMAQSRAVQG